MIHQLKTDPVPFEAVWTRIKRCEVRKDDRGFKVGDLVQLREWEGADYTGRVVTAEITHIQRGYGLPDNLVVMSLYFAEE